MSKAFNPIIKFGFDEQGDSTTHNHDSAYVNVSGDTMTGALTITPSVDALSIFQVNDKDSNVILSVDTTNNRVGIGTTSPGYKFEVENTSAITGSTEYLLGAFDRASYAEGIYLGYYTNAGGTAVQEGRVRSGGDVPLALGTSTYSQALYILNSNGNVGIGLNNPVAKLHVKAADTVNVARFATTGKTFTQVDFMADSASMNFYILDSTYSTSGAFTADSVLFYTDNATGGLSFANAAADGFIRFYTGGSAVGNERLRIDNTGNVGIGTTSPGAKLQITGTADDQQLIVKANSSQTANLQEWQNSSGGVLASVSGTGSASFSNLLVALNQTGATKVSVQNENNQSTDYAEFTLVNVYGAISGMRLNPGGGGASGFGSYIDTVIWNSYNSSSLGGIVFSTHNGTSQAVRMTLNTLGNLGIGQAEPASKLSVNGGISAGSYSGTAAPSNGMIISGSVGIGTTTPGANLEIVGTWAKTLLSGDNIVIRKPNYSSGGWARNLMQFEEYDEAILFILGAMGDNNTFNYGYIGQAYDSVAIAWDATNKVGIGDTTPGEKLDVNGNINATGVLKIDDVQVVSNRIVDARIDDTPNSGDATTDGIIAAIQSILQTHGLAAAA